MLSGQSTSRPRLAAHRRNRGNDRLSPEDGHARGAKAVSPTQPRDRVLPRLDQKQTGTAPVPPARLGQSANGNALGLPHLQSATVDPTAQAASRIRRRLKRSGEIEVEKLLTQTKLRFHFPICTQPSRFFWGMGSGFFTASRGARRASSITPGQASESSVRYLPAFHSEMNRCPETPSTRWAWASTIAAACLRLIHLTLVVAAFFVLMLSPLPLLVLKNDPSSGPCQFETLIRSPTCSSG